MHPLLPAGGASAKKSPRTSRASSQFQRGCVCTYVRYTHQWIDTVVWSIRDDGIHAAVH